jgi:WD40 repeat protein
MLTPDDLEALAGVIIYTLSITGGMEKNTGAPGALPMPPPPMGVSPHHPRAAVPDQDEEKLAPGPVARIYLLRLLEELVVDGVNEIVSANSAEQKPQTSSDDPQQADTATTVMQPHAGGGTSANQYYFATSILAKKGPKGSCGGSVGASGVERLSAAASGGSVTDASSQHPKHQQAQAFLSAFAGILTPVWFACVLEGSREEASAAAALRLMMLMLQSSPTFSGAFEMAGGFSPLVLSIPKFSTCPAIILSMLSQLLHAPILHLPCFATLDATQLCEVFDLESDATELIINDSTQGGLHTPSDPSCGIFALLAECLGRNIQLASYQNEAGFKARHTNEAVIRLLGHRHTFSSSFQEFCRTPDFLEPLAQALCLVHDQKMKGMINMSQPPQDPFGTTQRRGGFGDAADDTDFLPWGNAAGPNVGHPHVRDPRTTRSSTQRRGSLCTVNRDETPTERLVGKGSSNVVTSGIGMVELLHLVLSHAVLSGPTAGTLLAALFRSFPIHASLEQVEAFHLVLIEHCRNVVEDALQRGEPIALANCIGVGSVLLDRLMAGFFTSEPVLETVNIVLATLRSLTATGTYASRTLANADQTMLVADTAHFARLTCLTALHRSRLSGPYDDGDDDLKLAVLEAIAKNLRQLLLIPGTTGGATTVGERASAERGKNNRQQNAGAFIPPQPNNRFYPLYQSASLSRCSPPGVTAIYPELFQVDQPDRAFVIALMSQIYNLLLDRRRDIREQAVVILISLLHQRRAFMQELLVTEIPRGENRMETVDLMNRGGFGALFIEESAMRDDSSQYTMSSRLSEMGGSGLGTGKLKYQSFFEWFNRNQPQIAAVFHGIHIHALRLLPGISAGASTPEEAIENEQKVMLLKLTSQDSSDRTIQGGIKRAELAENLHEKTGENHALWKRQGFDDLSSGAMLWKLLLRQLKGSHSIWEGGQNKKAGEETDSGIFSRKQLVDKPEVGENTAVDTTGDKKITVNDSKMRWKLDLTEGYERQRRRLLPNHEFQTLYKLDKLEKMEETKADSKIAITDPTGMSTGATGDPSAMDEEGVRNEERWKHLQNSWRRGGISGAVDALETTEITAAIVREMQMKVGAKDRDFFNDEDDDNEDQNEDMEDGMSQDDEFDNPNRDEYGDDMEMVNGDNERKSGDGGGVKPSDLEGDDIGDDKDDEEKSDDEDDERDNSLASSYDLITGLLEPGDWPEKSYNVRRCAGLEVRRALLLWCREAIYIVDGFEQTEGDGLEGKINRLQMSTNTYDINLREEGQGDASMPGQGTYSSSGMDRRAGANSQHEAEKAEGPQIAGDEITYQHRSQRIAFSDIYSVYRRRYQLQQIALEFYDVNRYGTFVSFSSEEEREEVLFKVLNSPLPNSIFSSMSGSVTINYNKFMNSLRAKITNQWVNGRMTNFEYIMHLNSFAGRTYNDLTQYPVFPWILSDYESEELDLDDPATYRDLSKPMGAQTEMRAAQYRERFEVLESSAQMNPDEPPPFHYGTHYSCAAYVLYYLMRLEPFSRMALSLQGGHFDHADRLFHNIGSSWKSASAENLQDVRELIPEFFYLGEFLVNSDNFDFGTTQGGKVVHDVTLPAWAKGDPARFIRMNRQALESDYVSRNLHHWLDLIFGYKQKGREADKALNKFVHLTYEGNVDLNEITDPIQREATIAQIHNFGQTPSKLERKPFPQRNIFNVAKEKAIDFSALFFLAALTPPFCVVGAPHRVYLRVSSIDTCRVGMTGQPDSSVGDMYWFKGQLVGVGRTCALILPSKKYYRFGGANNGVSVHVAIASARHREVNKVLSIHDGMHRSPISVAKPSLNGEWLVTGCIDSTVRVWRYNGKNVSLKASLCGHEGGKITCIDVSTTFGNVVTGGEDGNVLVWDLRRLTFLRQLKHKPEKRESKGYDGVDNGVISVSINHKNGNILTLIGLTLTLFDINGTLLATQDTSAYKNYNRPSCAIATSCPEWMENGVVGVTGHVNGDVRLWSMNYDTCYLVMRHLVPDKVHTCPITSLRVYGEMQDTLLVGDRSGKMSVCKTLRLDGLNQQELNIILKEIQSGAAISDSDDGRKFSNYEGD